MFLCKTRFQTPICIWIQTTMCPSVTPFLLQSSSYTPAFCLSEFGRPPLIDNTNSPGLYYNMSSLHISKPNIFPLASPIRYITTWGIYLKCCIGGSFESLNLSNTVKYLYNRVNASSYCEHASPCNDMSHLKSQQTSII